MRRVNEIRVGDMFFAEPWHFDDEYKMIYKAVIVTEIHQKRDNVYAHSATYKFSIDDDTGDIRALDMYVGHQSTIGSFYTSHGSVKPVLDMDEKQWYAEMIKKAFVDIVFDRPDQQYVMFKERR